MKTESPASSAVLKIIWVALTGSHLFYLQALYTVLPGTNVVPPSEPPAIWIATVAFALASIILFRIKLSASALEKTFQKNPLQAGISRVLVPYILCWGLNEGVTLVGFVHTFVFDKRLGSFVPFLLTGLLLNIAMFPRVDAALKKSIPPENNGT